MIEPTARWVERLADSNLVLVNFRGARYARPPTYLARDHVAPVIRDDVRLVRTRLAYMRRQHNGRVWAVPIDSDLPPWA